MRRTRLAERAGIDLHRRAQFGEPIAELGPPGVSSAMLLGRLGAVPASRLRTRRRGSYGSAIERRGDDLPAARLERRLDVILGRQAVAVDVLAVAAPDHAVDRRRLGPGDRDTPLARHSRDPAPAVAGRPSFR